ncbi:MAG TPA: ATP-binding protein [Polyangiaceae bacterium]|nr:ATP-binding protein [Polyangiaceae bacterium]
MSRVLFAFAVLALGFLSVAGWAVIALRDSAQKNQLVRLGYLPLTRTLRDLVTLQDTWNAQLNHITTARNPSDARVWFDSALRIGRPKKFTEARHAIVMTLAKSTDSSVRAIARDLLADIARLERSLEPEAELLKQLFDAIGSGNQESADRLRDGLLRRGLATSKRLTRIDQRVLGNVEAVSDESTTQQFFAVRLLVALSILTGLLGLVMAMYIRRVLRPLGEVTRRARDVADGDLSPRQVVDTGDEISELASAFESMVGAIAAMRKQMLATDRLATIGKMAAHVTHEIRNPLSSIALNIEMLEDELSANPEEARLLLAAVQKELGRLTALTEQYLSIARHGTTKIELEDLRTLVVESVNFVKRELVRKNIEVVLRVPDSEVVLAVDEMQIRQALFNLIRNAQEAMPEGGTVWIELSEDASGKIVLSVEDNGAGIDPQIAESLFEPFVTTKQTGTGLGLAVTQQIVKSHGGSIHCEQGERGGARFVIEFGRAETPSPALEQGPSP